MLCYCILLQLICFGAPVQSTFENTLLSAESTDLPSPVFPFRTVNCCFGASKDVKVRKDAYTESFLVELATLFNSSVQKKRHGHSSILSADF